ncbi:MAG: hypothetical protein LWW93_15940 [Hyphomicrobiales bacterium]|nr:hypothetical protein [Hyphomicrobiales bacterium]
MTARRTSRSPRGSTLAAIAVGSLVSLAVGLFAAASNDDPQPRRVRAAELVAALALSDVALFGEARYTRNPSLADLHSAFQDGPASLEHFPTGSLVAAPRAFPAGRLEAGKE